MVDIWFDLVDGIPTFKIVQNRLSKKFYALKFVKEMDSKRESPNLPRVMDTVKNWGNLEIAEIEEKFADQFTVFETKQELLEAL